MFPVSAYRQTRGTTIGEEKNILVITLPGLINSTTDGICSSSLNIINFVNSRWVMHTFFDNIEKNEYHHMLSDVFLG